MYVCVCMCTCICVCSASVCVWGYISVLACAPVSVHICPCVCERGRVKEGEGCERECVCAHLNALLFSPAFRLHAVQEITSHALGVVFGDDGMWSIFPLMHSPLLHQAVLKAREAFQCWGASLRSICKNESLACCHIHSSKHSKKWLPTQSQSYHPGPSVWTVCSNNVNLYRNIIGTAAEIL